MVLGIVFLAALNAAHAQVLDNLLTKMTKRASVKTQIEEYNQENSDPDFLYLYAMSEKLLIYRYAIIA